MFEKLVSGDVASLAPYPPGKPLEELEREFGIQGAIKLASNENPWGPSPKAQAALAAAIPNLHRYPDGRGYYLKQALARRLGVAMDQLVLGNGSNEIIELAVRTFLKPGREAVMSEPTFLMYSKVVQGGDGVIVRAPLKDFKHDLPSMVRAVGDNTRLLFLDNPNNPGGALTPVRELLPFLADLPRETIVVLDEAYRDFIREEEPIDPRDLIEGDRPIIFLRTFSKAYGLAGLRIGYGLAHRELVAYMDRVRQPFNVNTLGQIGALAALEDEAFYQQTRQSTWAGLDWLYGELDKLGLAYHSTQANFFMIELDRPADEVSKKMLHDGVIIRSLKSYGLENIIRLNVGRSDENERFIQSLRKALGR